MVYYCEELIKKYFKIHGSVAVCSGAAGTEADHLFTCTSGRTTVLMTSSLQEFRMDYITVLTRTKSSNQSHVAY